MQSASPTSQPKHPEIAVFGDVDDGLSGVAGSGAPFGGKSGYRVSPQQRIFCREYVANGGNANQARIAAGYASSHSALKNLCNANCVAEIKRLSMVHSEAKLPELMRRLIDIALDPETPKALAADTSFKLMDRMGLKPKSGPLIAIQNNDNSTNVQTADPQALIAEIWKSRGSRVSGISNTMADRLADAEPAVIEHHSGNGEGGGVAQGPVARSSSILPHSDEREAEDDSA